MTAAVTNPNFHATGSHDLNADTTAFMQLVQADRLFRDLPELRFVIPHGGGAVPYHWGRFRGLADMLGRPPVEDAVMGNVFFDTCVYHQPGIDLLFDPLRTAVAVRVGSDVVDLVLLGTTLPDTQARAKAAALAAGWGALCAVGYWAA